MDSRAPAVFSMWVCLCRYQSASPAPSHSGMTAPTSQRLVAVSTPSDRFRSVGVGGRVTRARSAARSGEVSFMGSLSSCQKARYAL
jgi:hypothetical protein